MKTNNEQHIWDVLATVHDPEVPVLSITDLGIVRAVINQNNQWLIQVTPTYSGCPATDVINMQIRMALLQAGISNFKIEQVLSPAWTTDWMSEEGKQKLKAYGIAPPMGKLKEVEDLNEITVTCPQCNSTNTTVVSVFGSTACKALFKCLDCKEPFDYFKCH